MNITGLITEYNPFHLGHEYHLKNALNDTKCDGTICIMSGNFIQRGGPSLIDKWTRAEIAVKNGIDLVIELPLIYACSSAEYFCEGAVKILNATNVVNNIYFGSEHGNIEDLKYIAKILSKENSTLKNLIKHELDNGLPFHKARENSLKLLYPNSDISNIICNSNNILGIEYLKALYKLDSKIQPFTLKRAGSGYNEVNLTNKFPSATAIRNALSQKESLSNLKSSLPKYTYEKLDELSKDNYKFVFNNDIFEFLKYKIITQGQNLNKINDVNEGLDFKILKEISTSNSLDELILKVKSKRYTYTRISRILTSFFIGLENYDMKNLLRSDVNYIRPLAFNATGSKILKEIKNQGCVEIITKLPKKISNPILELDILGTKAYSIVSDNISPYSDYLISPKYIK